MPLEAKEEYLLHSWSDSKWAHFVHCEEIFDSKLELLTPLWQDMLGLCCSATAHDCSVTHHGGRTMSPYCLASFAPAQTSSRRRCTMGTRCSGTSCGGYDPGYPRQTIWDASPGAAQPTRRSLARHDSARRLPQDIGKIS